MVGVRNRPMAHSLERFRWCLESRCNGTSGRPCICGHRPYLESDLSLSQIQGRRPPRPTGNSCAYANFADAILVVTPDARGSPGGRLPRDTVILPSSFRTALAKVPARKENIVLAVPLTPGARPFLDQSAQFLMTTALAAR